MLKKSRLYVSAMLAALVLASLLITSNVNACGEPPQTLLSLYMNSNLIVLAKYESNGESKKSSEDEYGHSVETTRNLSVIKVYKGQNDLKNVSLLYSQYVPNPSPSNAETGAEIVAEETEHYPEGDYFDISNIKIGEQYLFFLTKNEEIGQYDVTDYVSGAKQVSGKLDVYEKNLSELADITASAENKSAKLAEWIVKSIEEPLTREDGISDLAESFYGLNNSSNQPEESGEQSEVSEVVSEGYGGYTGDAAAKLSQAQIARVSAVLYPMLQEAWFAETPHSVNYGISTILGGFSKPRLATHAYSFLQSVGKEDFERRTVIMEFLTSVVEDQTLTTLYYEYSELHHKINAEGENDTPEAKKQVKILIESKNAALRNFDKRFKFTFERNFAKIEVKQAEEK